MHAGRQQLAPCKKRRLPGWLRPRHHRRLRTPSTRPHLQTLIPHTLQVGFKRTLLQDIKAFVADAAAFRQDWEANGPTLPGLSPMDAADRLRKYQQLFEVRKRKWESYASGEELFGLPVTQYPELERTREEIAMLDMLYRWEGGEKLLGQAGRAWQGTESASLSAIQQAQTTEEKAPRLPASAAALHQGQQSTSHSPSPSLYVSVITTIRGWGDDLWVDVVGKIDAMGSQVRRPGRASTASPPGFQGLRHHPCSPPALVNSSCTFPTLRRASLSLPALPSPRPGQCVTRSPALKLAGI